MLWKDTGVGIRWTESGTGIAIVARLVQTEEYPITEMWIKQFVENYSYLPKNWIVT